MSNSGSLNANGEAILKLKKNYFKEPGSYNLNFLFKETGNTKTITINVAPLPISEETIREAIVRIALGWVGITNAVFDTGEKKVTVDKKGVVTTTSIYSYGDFSDPYFDEQIRKGFTHNYSNSPGSHWCNWFADLVWREAYIQVGQKDPKIKEIFQTILQSKVYRPLAAGVWSTLSSAEKLGFGERFAPNNDGILRTNPKHSRVKPGDMVIYSWGHVNIVVKVYPDGSFDTVGGNETYNKKNGVNHNTNKYFSEKTLHTGIVRPPGGD